MKRSNFNPQLYLNNNPDVKEAGVDPFRHYQEYGKQEGRTNVDPEFYLQNNPDVAKAGVDPVEHYKSYGKSEFRAQNRSQYTDPEFQNQRDVFGKNGLTEGETFTPEMDTGFNETAYLAANPDVAQAVQSGQVGSAKEHWEKYGKYEGRNPGTLMENDFEIDPNKYQQDAVTANAPTRESAQTYNASTVDPNNIADGTAAQGQLSQDAQAEAATRDNAYQDYSATIEQARNEAQQFELDKRATVQHQYNELLNYEPGDIPKWAKGAIREAESRMASRGLGASSMAGQAVSSATLKAALPIAQQDARAFQTMSLEKFNKRHQATLMKASHLANLDMQSLNNRQQTAVANAQAFLQMDMTNLNNRQQMAIVNTQSRVQAMLSNQAAENAAKQFNAKSENDMNMFYSSLETQVEQFNASQQNDMAKFNAEVANQREQFNTKNAMLIEQSNIEYLRDISTKNTEMLNQANYVNSQNLLDISNTAMANQIQLMRDREAFAHEMGENAKDRVLSRWMTAKKIDAEMDIADQEMWAGVGAAVGDLAGNVLGHGLENSWFSAAEGSGGVFDWF